MCSAVQDRGKPHGSIADWLNDIGLRQFRSAFAQQQIALEDLPELGEHDPEKAGIPLGARKRLPKAIAGPDLAAKPTRPDRLFELQAWLESDSNHRGLPEKGCGLQVRTAIFFHNGPVVRLHPVANSHD